MATIMSDEVLVWLFVRKEIQMISVWSTCCHCHSIISCFIKIQIGLTFLVPAYSGCLGKEAVKWVSVYNIIVCTDCVCVFWFASTVDEEKLATLDSLLRLAHYVAVLDADWTRVVHDATQHRNNLDEALEVQMLSSWRQLSWRQSCFY